MSEIGFQKQKGYVDIHCHILPGIDDGAKDLEETTRMLRIAHKCGFTRFIVTPHFHNHRGKASPEERNQALEKAQQTVAEIDSIIQLYLGNEIFYSNDCLEQVKSHTISTMAESSYVLLEFAPEEAYATIRRAVCEFLAEGYFPIIAHVERYLQVKESFDRVKELYDMGAYIQVNGRTITGQHGRRDKMYVMDLMKYDLVHFVASDAHDCNERSPDITQAIKVISKKFGENRVQRYFYENPEHIFQNKLI